MKESNPFWQSLKRDGPCRFDRFMAYALYDPECGYYAKAPRIGRSGDFYTSVSVGPLFGRILAAHAAQVWKKIGSPPLFDLIEQGTHSGQLSADLLSGLEQDFPDCYRAARLHLIESTPGLKAAQEKTLLQSHPDVNLHHWETPAEVPDLHWNGFFYSNELPDSFPVRRFCFESGAWKESWVEALPEGRFGFVSRDLTGAESILPILERIPACDGYTTEINEFAPRWIQGLAQKVRAGEILTIDYGYEFEDYYSVDRTKGTLRAYFQHRASDEVLERVGEQDLTAHVNFTSLIEAGNAAGLRLVQFTDQHHYLVEQATPLLKTLEKTASPQSPEFQKWIRAFKTLMHPEIMGTRFKVLVQSKGMK